MSKIIMVSNEDADVCGAVKPNAKLTKLGAFRAIKKELRDWGNSDEEELSINDLETCEFYLTTGGEHDGWIWWSYPKKWCGDSKIEYLGMGWIYKIY